MFLQELNEMEKRAFLSLAKEIIKADKKLVPEESYMLHLILDEMGLEIEDALEFKKTEDLFKQFKEKRSQKIVIVELIGLGYSEGLFNTNERAIVEKGIEKFGLGKPYMEKVENWVKKQIEVFTEINNLLEE